MFPRRSEPPHLWQVPHTSPDEPAEFPSDADLLDLLLLDLRTRIEFECTPRCGADSIVTRGGNRRRRLTGRVATRCGSSARPTPGGTSRLRLSSSLLLIQLSHFTHLVSGESSGWGPRIPFLAISREIPQTTNPVYAVPGTGTGSFTRAPSANFTLIPSKWPRGMNTSTQESRKCVRQTFDIRDVRISAFPSREGRRGGDGMENDYRAFHSLSPRASAGRKRRAERRGDAPPGPAALPRTNARREARRAIQLSRPGAAARRRRRRMTRRRRRPRGETRARRRGVRRFLCHLRGGGVGFGGRGRGRRSCRRRQSRTRTRTGKRNAWRRRRLALRRAARRAMPSLRRAAPSSLRVRVRRRLRGVVDGSSIVSRARPRVREPRPEEALGATRAWRFPVPASHPRNPACTQDGHPSAQGHSATVRSARSQSPSISSYALAANPTPLGHVS